MLAGLGIQRHQRVVGLVQKDLAVTISHAAVDRVAAHHRDHARILLRLVLPQDLAIIVEIERVDNVRERRVHVHHIADDQRSAFMTPQHAGRKRPCHLQLADIPAINLLECRKAGIGIILCWHGPVIGILGILGVRRTGSQQCGRADHGAHRK